MSLGWSYGAGGRGGAGTRIGVGGGEKWEEGGGRGGDCQELMKFGGLGGRVIGWGLGGYRVGVEDG